MAENFSVLEKVLEQHERVIFAYLFGSLARRTGTSGSDVDVAVYLDETADPFEEKMSLVGAFTRTLHTEDIDLVVLNSAPLSLVGRILAHRVVLLDRKPHLRHRYESLLLRQFQDFYIKAQVFSDSTLNSLYPLTADSAPRTMNDEPQTKSHEPRTKNEPPLTGGNGELEIDGRAVEGGKHVGFFLPGA